MIRDRRNVDALEQAQWGVFTVWECTLERDTTGLLSRLDALRKLRATAKRAEPGGCRIPEGGHGVNEFEGFEDGQGFHVDVPYVHGVASYIVRLCCEPPGQNQLADDVELIVVDTFQMVPFPDMPVLGHRWSGLDPAREWRVHVTPVLA